MTTNARSRGISNMKQLAFVIVLAASLGLALYQNRRAAALDSHLTELKEQNASLAAQLEQQKNDRDAAEHRAQLNAPQQAPPNDSSELLRLRGEVGALRRQLATANAIAPPATNKILFSEPYLTRDAWSDQGTDKPLNTILTMLSALRDGDDAKLDKLLSPSHSPQTLDSLRVAKEEQNRITALQIVKVARTFQGGGRQFATIEAVIEKSPLTSGETKDLEIASWTLEKADTQWLLSAWR